jgi:hypothetical protein
MSRPALVLLPRQRLSVPAIEFAVEPFTRIAPELPSLFARHYDELAENKEVYPLDPDWDRYFAMDIAGILKVLTVRVDDILVGYIFNLVGPHLHSKSTRYADIEMFWFDPLYRDVWMAVKAFRENENFLKSLGVVFIHVSDKIRFKKGKVDLIFKRLGYRPIETNWSKVLGS